ncbi:hypothetical protein QE152_g31018 [Popillia japonica]|uniref:Uncharacterized protein n=1 Tax=Popillia japonica TaxID=7064 RepID=A0AAW1JCW0_POPJA
MKGDVMLEIHGGKEKAEVLKHEIMNKNCGTKVEIKNRNGDISKDEIVTAIKNNVGGIGQSRDTDVVSVRPTQHGGQNATVVLDKMWAKAGIPT